MSIEQELRILVVVTATGGVVASGYDHAFGILILVSFVLLVLKNMTT